MLSLLVLSLAISAPLTSAQSTAPQARPPQQVNGPFALEYAEPLRTAEDLEIHPNSDVCYKIRAYIFSRGRNPKFLRETTCGPITPSTKKMNGKPGVMPLDIRVSPDGTTGK